MEAKTNPRAFWSFINSKTKSKTGITDLKKGDGSKTKSISEKVELLNDFFQSVFTTEDAGPIPDPPNYDFSEELRDIDITTETVRKSLENLRPGKAPGPDSLSPDVLRNIAEELAEPLTHLIRMTLDSGKLPEDWKKANVIPVHKKGSKMLANNYRPISLTCIICKVIEKIIRDKIMEHLLQNSLICKEQHGFVPGKSCTTQLLDALDTWTSIVDEGGNVDVIYMDFQKAFDSVPHRRLLAKVSSHGIRGTVLRWIENFLTGRKQSVVLDGTKSREVDVTSGIPQGSVLGPLLFIIYINDLPKTVTSLVKLFADDTKMYSRTDTPTGVQNLQDDLDKLQEWSDTWLLKFHPQKCCVLRFGSGRSETDYSMATKAEDGTPIRLKLAQKNEEKDLGITIDDRLKFKEHIAQVTTKANKIVGIIRRSFQFLTYQTFVQLFKSLVRPVLEYGQCVWHPHQKTLSRELEDVQRRATRLLGSLKDKPYPERLKFLRLPSLEHRRHRGDMIEVYKYLHGYYKSESPMLQLARSDINLRQNSMKLQKNRFTAKVRENFFSNRTVNSWNSLPDSVVTAPTLNAFKSRLDRHWHNLHTIYNPDCLT